MTNIQDYQFRLALKTLPEEGNLVYEYNPFYNYRLNETKILFRDKLYTIEEFSKEFGVEYEDNSFKLNGETLTSWKDIPGISSTEAPPVVYQKGQLTNFETDELHFSLKNPVNILPQYSYDDSVNLIINDGLNPPRIINSRFSATERNKYQVCNRKGNNDTNIYDEGIQFDIDTSLYKKITTIPRLTFGGIEYGGNMSIGNYHFYFKYVDEDGNESDFFLESGLVSIFIGNTPNSIYSGFRNENSHKQVKFLLQNLDQGYEKIRIYYTKSTSDIYQNATVSAFIIDQNYYISKSDITVLTINGYEPVVEVSVEEINTKYQIYGAVETQAAAQNILFLGNLSRPKIPYRDLADCALRFLPYQDSTLMYPSINVNYSNETRGTYWDPSFIYNYTGYWDDEIYRLGVVFIQSDNTLTDVFNIRGGELPSIESTGYAQIDMFDKQSGLRKYIKYDEETNLIIQEEGNSTILHENAKGVVKFQTTKGNAIHGIQIRIKQEVLDYLYNTLNIKGFFIVRQKRIPTTLGQAYIIGVDKESKTPVLPVKQDGPYIAEGFLTKEQRILTHELENRLYTLEEYEVDPFGAICPEYDVNSPYLNTLFSGSNAVIRLSNQPQSLTRTGRHLYLNEVDNLPTMSNTYQQVRIVGVEDNVKLVAIGDNMFSARAGEAEEAFRYEYIGQENKATDSDNLIRGSFGPYLGITGTSGSGYLVDIKIPDYSVSQMSDYFSIRYNDKSPYYAISDRVDLDNIDYFIQDSNSEEVTFKTMYRGDCYICQFTHRFNRNFQDPSAPTNDDIVDPNCWKDHYQVTDGVVKTDNFQDINLGDVNAVGLGLYVTLPVRSTMNLNIRALDESNVDEKALFGHSRSFYPYSPITIAGTYKTAEALCYNKGFEKSLSERSNFEISDVPWIKNEFSNRIAYSNVQVKDAFQNGWRTFMGINYRDYPKTYGSITKLVELRGNLVCVFEHGVALIPVNERAIAGEGAGGNVYVNTSNVLPENPKVISDVFGSQWRESVIKTPMGIYGVDTVAKKIWRTNGDSFECISDFKIQEFLNHNISLTERELEPIIGVRNVKTHYNRFKQDVMFTFYDNLYGFEERVWNICFNELQQKWITFYSWVPSYSENIYNQYFSFDRNTSKWIAKLGTSTANNDFSDGITLDNTIIENDNWRTKLSLSNRNLPQNVEYTIKYKLERDPYGNYKKFEINGDQISLIGSYDSLLSELYERDEEGAIRLDDKGRKIPLENKVNADKIVILLNIKAEFTFKYYSEASLEQYYASGISNQVFVDGQYYESTIAVIPKYNMQYLTTDFWKHGQAGIIDISDKIYPTYWYGKQHPFEFEFVVVDNPSTHKIFDNLQIISNSAEPESFHYEIVGDVYDFAKDKKNMYIRQEATKELYQYNGCDITYNHDYNKQQSIHRPLLNSDGKEIPGYYDKSTLMPLYYSRQDTINEVEDYYHLKDNVPTKDFSALAGGEIVYYDTLDEYRIWNHTKAVNMQSRGRLRGNMQYNEDQWLIQINPINVVQKNEKSWDSEDLIGNRTISKDKVPIELGQSPIPDEVLENGDITYDPDDQTNNDIPQNSIDRAIVSWNWNESQMSEVKVKDKWIKIRVRYSGTKLAIITAITTLYSISYA